MNYALKVVAGLFGLFTVAATVYGWFLIGGYPLIALVPIVGYLAYILWRKVL